MIKKIAANLANFYFFFSASLFFPLTKIYAADKGLGCDDKDSFGLVAKFLCTLTQGNADNTKQVGTKLNAIISSIIGVLTVIAGLWFLIQIIVAGYGWIGSGGDGKKVTEARDKITNSLIGLLMVVIAWIIVAIVGQLIGLNILNPGETLSTLTK